MKIKKYFNKIIVSIIIFLIVLGSLENYVKGSTVDFSSAYLIEIAYSYYSNKENNNALPDGDAFKGQSDEALYNNIKSAIETAWGVDPASFINEFNSSYSSAEGTETEKNKAALANALSKISQFSGTANSIVNFAENKISQDIGDTGNTSTENGTTSGETTEVTETSNVDENYIKQLLYEYYTSSEYANVTGGVTASVAEQKAQDLIDKYGAQMVKAYNDAYNSSSLTDENEKKNYAFQQAIAVADGEDAILDGDVTSESLDIGAKVVSGVASFLNGIVGIFFYFVKLLPMLCARVLMSIIGLAINGTDSAASGLSLDKILFNEIPILGINFFETATGTNAGTINLIRTQVSIWYVAIRNLAAVILAIIALYIGIRMAISSVAEEKARYKKMLTDWVVSIVLLFVLHYIMIFIININDGLVEVLKVARDNSTNDSTIMDEAFNRAMSFSDILSFTSQVANMAIYVMLAVMTFIFFCTYVKRMVTIAFLIMISPLITITYSLDRMGDGKSQALNTWFKNFVYNILLQPFHCIIYLALVQTAISSMKSDDLSTIVVAIIMVFFMFQAEEIIKEIFHFQGKSVAQTIAQAALVTSAIGAVTKVASAGSGKVKGYASRGNPNTKQSPSTKNPAVPGTPGTPGTPGNTTPANGGTSGVVGAATGNSAAPNLPMGNSANPIVNSAIGTINNANTNANNRNGVLRKIGGAATGFAKFGLKQAGKLPLAVMLGAAGLATGRVENAISGFNTGMNISTSTIAGMEENANLRNFAKNYKDMVGDGPGQQNIYAGRDDSWIRDHVKDLLNGDVQVQDYEKDYYNLIRNEQDRYINAGLSADDAVTQVEQNVAGIQRGNISELSTLRRFTGNIKNRFSGV